MGESIGLLREHHLFAVNKQVGFFGKIFQEEIDIIGVLHPVKAACRLVVLPVENLYLVLTACQMERQENIIIIRSSDPAHDKKSVFIEFLRHPFCVKVTRYPVAAFRFRYKPDFPCAVPPYACNQAGILPINHIVYSERFSTYIDEIMDGDADRARFLQKILGYGLTGDTRHECMTILYGVTTRNGKGTLCESVLKVLGDYGCASRPETIAMKSYTNSSQPSEDIARLAGVRFVNIPEPGKGMVLDAAKVKAMTGNDTLNARFLHENSFDFQPQFKIYVNTNFLPVINDMTLFSSDRIIIIPFDRHFDEQSRDTTLKRQFAEPQVQSAILNWLLEGYRLLRSEGLRLPKSVKEATDRYQHDSDKMILFFEDNLVADDTAEELTSTVYARYKGWCQENGCYPEGMKNFKQGLQAFAQVVRKRPKQGGEKTTVLLGYRLISEFDAPLLA